MKILEGQLNQIPDLPIEEFGLSTLITGHCLCPKCRVMNHYVVAKVSPAITSPEQGMEVSNQPFSLRCAKCGEVSDLSKYPRRPSVSGHPEDLLEAGFNEASAFKLMSDDELMSLTFDEALSLAGAELIVRKFNQKLERKRFTISQSVAVVAMMMFEVSYSSARDEMDHQAVRDFVDLIHRIAMLYTKAALEDLHGPTH